MSIDPMSLRLGTLEAVKRDALEMGDDDTVATVNAECQRRLNWARDFSAALRDVTAGEGAFLNSAGDDTDGLHPRWAARGHCTPQLGRHSPICDRDGQFCSMVITHPGPCTPHGTPR